MVLWDPMALMVLEVPKVLLVQMLLEDQVTQLVLEVPGTRSVPEGHLGPRVLDLQRPHLRPGHHHFLLVRVLLEVQQVQVLQVIPGDLWDL